MVNLFSATQYVVKCSRCLMASNDYHLHTQDNTDKPWIAQGGRICLRSAANLMATGWMGGELEANCEDASRVWFLKKALLFHTGAMWWTAKSRTILLYPSNLWPQAKLPVTRTQ